MRPLPNAFSPIKTARQLSYRAPASTSEAEADEPSILTATGSVASMANFPLGEDGVCMSSRLTATRHLVVAGNDFQFRPVCFAWIRLQSRRHLYIHRDENRSDTYSQGRVPHSLGCSSLDTGARAKRLLFGKRIIFLLVWLGFRDWSRVCLER
jgi:hypothetical protein